MSRGARSGRSFTRGGTIALATALACSAGHARAGFGIPTGPASEEGAAQRYGQLDRNACEGELEQRGIAFARVDEARGVLAPIRLAGPLHGVSFHTGLALGQRASSPWEIVDCRLALALDDFALQLRAHDIVEVVHYSIYRPPAKWPADRIASRHPGGLAIDAATFKKADGTTLEVERDFHGRIGSATCGPLAAPHPATPAGLELRQIVCDAADAKLFNVALTPNYNWKHRNHFHLEVAAGIRWSMIR